MALLYRVLGAHLLLFLALGSAIAEPSSILGGSLFFQNRAILAPLGHSQPLVLASKQNPSLFSENGNLGFFAPLPTRPAPVTKQTSSQIPIALPSQTHVMTAAMRARYRAPQSGTSIEKIRYIIGQAESHRDGYNAVQHGAKIRPSKQPTHMTIQDIYAWIEATPGQPHAIGRYQFIPKTLRRLVAELDVPQNALFTPDLQDTLSDILLADAGLHEFQTGQMKRHDFMNNLAKIWAGLPTSNGKSHYHGFAGNKASITWKAFDAQMQNIQSG
jgi:muramidase (phage lysozyme)